MLGVFSINVAMGIHLLKLTIHVVTILAETTCYISQQNFRPVDVLEFQPGRAEILNAISSQDYVRHYHFK